MRMRLLILSVLAWANTAWAMEQFSLVCEDGTVLGEFTEGQAMVGARDGERPLILFYCPVDRTLLTATVDKSMTGFAAPSVHKDSTCAQPLVPVDEVYMQHRKPFPLCHGGYLAPHKVSMIAD